jgi:hypothetical protein
MDIFFDLEVFFSKIHEILCFNSVLLQRLKKFENKGKNENT